jgi:transcriptional regulator with PAS, ATPase and Fis domain
MSELLLRALGTVAGPAIVLDEELRVVAWTEGTEALTGPLEANVPAPRLLCGEGLDRPIAEALAEGRATAASLPRIGLDGAPRSLRVRATPLDGGSGWLLVVSEEIDASPGSLGEGSCERWGILTRSPTMKALFRDLAKVARRDVTVLVRGESGSGKELVAHAIHLASKRSKGPFRAINCAALPPTLLESELFGHVRGAFTGAVRDNPGHFRAADGGTLFLDEIGELPLELQAKLLRVLQERSVIPVGGRDPLPVDVRIVSATNRSLREEVAEGRFRADLMYRLRVVPLFLPPLRARREDVAVLVERFLARLSDDERKIEHVSAGAMRLLESYDWPGNVRELQNVVEHAFVMGDGPVLLESDLPPELRGEESHAARANVPPPTSGRTPEETRIRRALERVGGHRGRAAAILGMSRSTLWRKMRSYGLDEGEENDADEGTDD